MDSLDPPGQLLPPWPCTLVPCHCHCSDSGTAGALECERRASLRLLRTHVILPSPPASGEARPSYLPSMWRHLCKGQLSPCASPLKPCHGSPSSSGRGRAPQPGIPAFSCESCSLPPSPPTSHPPHSVPPNPPLQPHMTPGFTKPGHAITPLNLCTCSPFCLQCPPTSVTI